MSGSSRLGTSYSTAAYRTLNRLNETGIAISLDDFGTGYSSLARLEAFPFRKLKIEAQFVRGLEHDNRKRRIVSAVVGLGQSLNITVVEGVETNAEAAILRRLGCPLGQGWLYGKGVPAPEAQQVHKHLSEMAAPASILDASPFQQLHQLEAPYDQAPVGLSFLDLHFRYVRANDIFATMHGVTGRELEGRSIYEVLQGENLPRFEAVLSKALGPNPLPPQDYVMGKREYRVFAQKVADEGGENLGFSLVAIEVTEQNRVFRTLEQSEEHFRHAVELNPDIAWAATAEGDVYYISPTFEDLPNDTMRDRTDRWMAKMHPDDRTHVRSNGCNGFPAANLGRSSSRSRGRMGRIDPSLAVRAPISPPTEPCFAGLALYLTRRPDKPVSADNLFGQVTCSIWRASPRRAAMYAFSKLACLDPNSPCDLFLAGYIHM
ncbi:PAS domain S-box-containing protein [Rhizobium sp. NFACC06-2]|nr:EAL domain-containing protein [Rhizobium sp. NFACC06-2]SCY90952.1 PAS domain S-box-containing protein [Rhizobium sp. NFACC06-2]